jgi:hypothetical protein
MVRYRTQCKQFFAMKPKTAEKCVLEAAFTLFCEHGFSDYRMEHSQVDQS